jgi:hypothetical protein
MSFKNLLLKNHWARKAQIYMTASLHSGDSSLFKSWFSGDGATIGKNHLNTFVFFLVKHWTRKDEFT